jgi:hypothetical protein
MTNDQNEIAPSRDTATAAREELKKPYQKPSFQHERIFETMALTCGKMSSTQAQCHFNRKSS